jgi:hypothetical protein
MLMRIEPCPLGECGMAIRRCVFLSIAAGCLLGSLSQLAAEEQLLICHAGLITVPSFAQHIADLHAAKRFDEDRIEKLIARQKKGGADFFSSQVVIQEQISASGTYDLRLFHGLSGPHTKYRNLTGWACDQEDYPIVYFVGLRVREIRDGSIQVSREKDVVNIISLKRLNPRLDTRTTIELFQDGRILCSDIRTTCIDAVLYDRYES